MKTPTLETDRLILRSFALEDAPAIQKYFNNWNIIQYLATTVPWPYPEDGAIKFIQATLEKMEKERVYAWVITEKNISHEAIGCIEYREKKANDGHRGFWLAEHLHGKGYMTEAVSAVNDFLFFELGIDRYEVTNIRNNVASRRVKEKTGAIFKEFGVLEHRNGEKTTEVWEVTRENWARIRGKA